MTEIPRTPWSLRVVWLVVIDTVMYAVFVGTAAFLLSLVLGVATGGGLVRTKVLMFLVGFGMMGYATIRLWPGSPAELERERDRRRRVAQGADRTDPRVPTVQSMLERSPIGRLAPTPPADRETRPATKLLVASLFVLLASLAMEVFFGIE